MKRRNIMVLMISLSLILLLGSSYALLRSTQVGSTPYVINVGTLQVTFEGSTDKLTLENMYPMSDKEGSSQSKELGFVVKNTGTVASYYDITLEETSTTPEFKSVIRFISNKDNQGYNEPKTLSEDKYIEVGGYLKPNISSNYKVKIWLDYNAGNEYMDKTFTAKVVVNSFQESNYAKDVIKNQLVKYEESSKENFKGGLIAINTNGDLYNETIPTQEIREYRYSGPSVNNYVTFNDEEWRIVGIFKDENGEHLKIVRNNFLSGIFPETYTINKTTYNIMGQSGDFAYWDYKIGYNDDWSTAGLQYWLNTTQDETADQPNKGYLSYLKGDTLSMIEDTKYYLGTITYNGSPIYGITDTPKEVYANERAVEGCVNNKGASETITKDLIEKNNSCRVWANNPATWEGKVALLYPSDYGLSIPIGNWETQLKDFSTIQSYSWLNSANHNDYEWLLSPSTGYFTSVARWNPDGKGDDSGVDGKNSGVRPCLYLKSNVKITEGKGSELEPYKLILE